jgi:hypothetical protein
MSVAASWTEIKGEWASSFNLMDLAGITGVFLSDLSSFISSGSDAGADVFLIALWGHENGSMRR